MRFGSFSNNERSFLPITKIHCVGFLFVCFPPELEQCQIFKHLAFFPAIRIIYTCPSGGCQACRKLSRHGLFMSVLDFSRFFFYLNYSLYVLTKFFLKTSFFHYLFVMICQNRSSVILSSNFKFLVIHQS